MKFITLCKITIASIIALTNASLLAQEWLGGEKTIIIGTEGTYPPFTYHNESGKLTGYDVEVARAVAEKLGLNVEFKETPWNALLSGLNNGRFDAVVNQVTMNDERRTKYVSSTPYSYSGVALAINSQYDKITKLSQLTGLKGGLAFTSNFADLARANGAEVEPISGGLGQEIKLVAQKRIDFTLNDRLAVLYYQQQMGNPDSIKVVDLPEEGTVSAGFILRKEDTQKRDKLNAALEALRKEGRLAEISKQFFGVDISEQ